MTAESLTQTFAPLTRSLLTALSIARFVVTADSCFVELAAIGLIDGSFESHQCTV
jgi:hypothetical protein